MRHDSLRLPGLTCLLCFLVVPGLLFSQPRQERKPKRFDPRKMHATVQSLTNSQKFTAKDVTVEKAFARFVKLEIQSGLLEPAQLAARTPRAAPATRSMGT